MGCCVLLLGAWRYPSDRHSEHAFFRTKLRLKWILVRKNSTSTLSAMQISPLRHICQWSVYRLGRRNKFNSERKTILQHRPSLSARRTVSYQNFRPPDFKSECQPVKFSRFTTRTLSFFGISELFDQWIEGTGSFPMSGIGRVALQFQ